VTFEDVKVVAAKVQSEKGQSVAVDLIKQIGGGKLADMDESKYAQFIAAAEVLLAQEPEPAEQDL